jgi:SAM domain (Sterile alpha motif)
VEISAWLSELGLSQYEQVFRDNDIDADILSALTSEDLISAAVRSGAVTAAIALRSCARMASSGQRSNPAAAGHGPHGQSRSQVPRHMLQIAMHCQQLLGDPSQLLMPKNESPKIIKDPKLPKCDFLTR